LARQKFPTKEGSLPLTKFKVYPCIFFLYLFFYTEDHTSTTIPDLETNT